MIAHPPPHHVGTWVAFALWVLTHRRVLLGRQSIVAGRMAVTFTGLFLMGALAVGEVARPTRPRSWAY